MRKAQPSYMKLTTCCLLAILTGTAALAQTHPEKKSARKPVVVRKQETEAPDLEPIRRMCGEIRIPSRSSEATQYVQPDSNKVYTYVEQMPMLNNQKGFLVIITAINQRLVVPPSAPNGRVFVQFEVNRQGVVNHPKIIKSLRADIDSAVVVATRQLPRFTPSKQNGRVVRVSFTLPITIPVAK
jgi:hypothetical protein